MGKSNFLDRFDLVCRELAALTRARFRYAGWSESDVAVAAHGLTQACGFPVVVYLNGTCLRAYPLPQVEEPTCE